MARPTRNDQRLKRKARIRRKVQGTPERPRLCVYKSLRHIYAQIVDDTQGRTLAAASTLTEAIRAEAPTATVAAAQRVGHYLAQQAQEKGIRKVVFDCSGYQYHGAVKALADAAREGGLQF